MSAVHERMQPAVASLGLVSAGAANDGVTTFFLKNLTTFLVSLISSTVSRPYYFSSQNWRPFFSSLISLRCHPRKVPPQTFLPVQPRFFTILCKFSHNFFHSGITTWRVSPGAVPLVTPLANSRKMVIRRRQQDSDWTLSKTGVSERRMFDHVDREIDDVASSTVSYGALRSRPLHASRQPRTRWNCASVRGHRPELRGPRTGRYMTPIWRMCLWCCTDRRRLPRQRSRATRCCRCAWRVPERLVALLPSHAASVYHIHVLHLIVYVIKHFPSQHTGQTTTILLLLLRLQVLQRRQHDYDYDYNSDYDDKHDYFYNNDDDYDYDYNNNDNNDDYDYSYNINDDDNCRGCDLRDVTVLVLLLLVSSS